MTGRAPVHHRVRKGAGRHHDPLSPGQNELTRRDSRNACKAEMGIIARLPSDNQRRNDFFRRRRDNTPRCSFGEASLLCRLNCSRFITHSMTEVGRPRHRVSKSGTSFKVILIEDTWLKDSMVRRAPRPTRQATTRGLKV